MTRIRATCPRCGDQELTSPFVELLEQTDLEWRYRFVCPSCRRLIVKPAEAGVAQLLARAEVDISAATPIPDYVVVQHSLLPPLSFDDLIDFGVILKSEQSFESWLVGLAAYRHQDQADL